MGTSPMTEYEEENVQGSSPRVWGQVSSFNCHFILIRIIPTRMGTSIGVLYDRWAVGDHPHAYGDKDNG